MAVPESTLRLVRGQDVGLRYTLAPAPAEGIGGWSVSWTLRRLSGGVLGPSLVAKAVGSGVTFTDPAAGVITVTLDDADTDALTLAADMPAGDVYLWDLRRSDEGAESVLARGDLVLLRNVGG